MRDNAGLSKRAVLAGIGLMTEAALEQGAAQASTGAKPKAADAASLVRLFGLEGKVVLLTDSGGHGHPEILSTLALAGATVVSADIAPIGYKLAVAEPAIAQRSVSYIACDIADEASVSACFNEVRSRFGRIDILVNAGGIYAHSPLAQVSNAQWAKVKSLSLDANFLCMREALRHMVETGVAGRIINLTTIGSVRPVLHGHSAYAAARAGVTMLGRTAAYDYASHGIRVNTILCGAIPGHILFDTDPNTAGPPSPTKRTIPPERIPLGGGSMTDVAGAVLYLVGPAGAYVTGQEIVVDGGFSVS